MLSPVTDETNTPPVAATLGCFVKKTSAEILLILCSRKDCCTVCKGTSLLRKVFIMSLRIFDAKIPSFGSYRWTTAAHGTARMVSPFFGWIAWCKIAVESGVADIRAQALSCCLPQRDFCGRRNILRFYKSQM